MYCYILERDGGLKPRHTGIGTYIGEKGRTLGKTYEIKARCYWEHPWEPVGNMLRTKKKRKKIEEL